MFVRLMGAPAIGDDAGDVVEVAGIVASTIVAAIALDPGRTVTLQQIEAAAWDEPPATSRNAVHVAVSRLRERYGREVVVTTPTGYRLDSALARVDAAEVEALAAEGDRLLAAGRPAEALGRCEDAARLAGGVPLAGLSTLWADGVRSRFESRLDALRVTRAGALLVLGRAGEALQAIEGHARTHPLDEGAAIIRMRALADLGRRAEALSAYDSLRQLLADELGVDPSPSAQAAFTDLLQPPKPVVPGPPAKVVRLPAHAGPTFGRDDRIASLCAIVESGQRLVTLVGPGGIGKTRVAVCVARELASSSPRSAWFVDLSDCDGPEELLARLDAVVDHSTSDHVSGVRGGSHAAVLRNGSHIVVLDNAEHLLEDTRSTALSLVGLGAVDVVVTSRRALEAPDERVVRLEPLETTGPDSPAARLLAARAQRWTSFGVDDPRALHDLAKRADGVPLALELIAGALRWRSPRELLAMADAELRGATDPTSVERHRSVRAAIDWNLHQLDADGLHTLGALLVMEGDSSIAAAIAVAATVVAERDARRVLSTLVDLSLIDRVPGAGEVRLRLLQPIRLAISDHPLVPAPGRAARAAHAAHHLAALERAVDALPDSDSAVIAVLVHDDRNVTAALEWAWRHDRDAASAVLGHCLYYWHYTRRGARLDEWTPRLADSAGGPDAALGALALFGEEVLRGRWAAGEVHRTALDATDDLPAGPWRALRVTVEAHRLRQQGRHLEAEALIDAVPPQDHALVEHRRLVTRGEMALENGRFEEALAAFDDIVARRLTEGSPSQQACALSNVVYASVIAGDLAHAAELVPQSVAWARSTGIPDDSLRAYGNAAWTALMSGDPGGALAWIAASIEVSTAPDDVYFLCEIDLIAALAFEQQGRTTDAHRAADALRDLIDHRLEGLLDPWATAVADGVLSRMPRGRRVPTYEEVVAAVTGSAATSGPSPVVVSRR